MKTRPVKKDIAKTSRRKRF